MTGWGAFWQAFRGAGNKELGKKIIICPEEYGKMRTGITLIEEACFFH